MSLHVAVAALGALSADAARLEPLVGRQPPAAVKRFPDGAVFWEYPALGLSLCFQGEPLALHTVHCFAPVFQGPLPYAPLRMGACTNADVVAHYGEPALKGGGAFAGDSVWIAYPDRGLQLEFAGCSWESRDLAIASAVSGSEGKMWLFGQPSQN